MYLVHMRVRKWTWPVDALISNAYLVLSGERALFCSQGLPLMRNAKWNVVLTTATKQKRDLRLQTMLGMISSIFFLINQNYPIIFRSVNILKKNAWLNFLFLWFSELKKKKKRSAEKFSTQSTHLNLTKHQSFFQPFLGWAKNFSEHPQKERNINPFERNLF